MSEAIAVGIDIGGTNVVAGFTTDNGKILQQIHHPIKKFLTPDDLVKTFSAEILSHCKLNNWQLKGIGIGAPNGNFFNGTIEFAPNLPWKGIIPLTKMFAVECITTAILTNDANAAAIGEMIFGAAKGLHDFIIITLGTGLGSGIVANGELIYGHDGFAGELGHTTAIRNGRLCGCGRKGCLETYASATGIVRTMKEWMSNGEETSLSKIPNEKITAWNVYEAAMQNDALAKKAFLFTAEILGQTLADAVAYTSPSAIILFGGLAKSGDLLLQPLKHFMEENLLQIYKNKVKILLSNLPESDAAVLGAAALIWKESKNIFQTI